MKGSGTCFVPRVSGCLEHWDCVLPARLGQLHCSRAFILLVLRSRREVFSHSSRNNSGNFVCAALQLHRRKLEKQKNVSNGKELGNDLLFSSRQIFGTENDQKIEATAGS